MTDINCEVIEDLLPLYAEDMASLASRALVNEHLETCKSCEGKLRSMQKEVRLPENNDATALKKISDKLYRSKIAAILMTVCIMLVICVVAVSNLHAPIRLSYEEVKDYIRIHPYADDSGMVEVYLCCPLSEVEVSYGIGEDGAKYAQITFYTNKWMKMHPSKDYAKTILLENPEWEGGSYPDKIYYSPQADGTAICIYQSKTFYDPFEYGYEELPRLVLNMYLVIAGVVAVLGLLVCLLVRRRDTRAFRIALKVTAVPVMYVISHILVLTGKGDIYNAQYYFTGIVLVTILLSLACWWGIALIFRKRYT